MVPRATTESNAVSEGRCLPKQASLVLVILALAALLLPGLRHGLWRPDEHCVAGICAEMARTGDVVVPHLNGKPYLEKPPLYYATAALCGRLFGQTKDWTYRLASLMFAAFALGTIFLLARLRLGSQGGLVAAGVLGSAWLFFRTSRWIEVDIALVFGVTLAMYAYHRFMDEPRARFSCLLSAGLAVAFMVKGLVGPALIGAAILLDAVRLRTRPQLLRWRPLTLCLSVAAIPVLLWCLALYYRGGTDFVKEVILVNNLERFAGIGKGATLGHQNGIGYYLSHFPGNFLPWTPLLIPALVGSVRNFRRDRFIAWFLGPIVLLCLSSTKRDVYLLPVYPAAACMIAGWLTTATRARWETVLVKGTWLAAGLLCVTPFAGLFIAKPFLGLTMGVAAVGCLAALHAKAAETLPRDIRLVLAVCVGLVCTATVYFSYLQPQKDYLGAGRQAIAAAHGEEITILCPDEILDGVLPLAAGKIFREAATPDCVREPGLYVWVDSRNHTLTAVRATCDVAIVQQREFGLHRMLVLARLTPHHPAAGPSHLGPRILSPD